MRSAATAQPRQFVRGAAVAAVLLGYAIHLGTLAHPFLLADNRHVLRPDPLRQRVQSACFLVRICTFMLNHRPVGECMDGGRRDAVTGLMCMFLKAAKALLIFQHEQGD